MGDFLPPPPPGGAASPPPGGFPPPGPQAPPEAYPPPWPPGYGAPGGAPPAPPFGAPDTYGPPPGFGGFAEKAGFFTRFAALIIDGIVTTLFAIPAYVALVTGDKDIEACSIDNSGNIDPTGSVNNGLCEVPSSTTWAIFAALLVVGVLAAIVYYAKLEGSGQTLGKRALGIKVVDARTGRPIGTGRGLGRYFARIPSGFVCYLGYLWMLWDPQKQTWHDKMVNSHVVKA